MERPDGLLRLSVSGLVLHTYSLAVGRACGSFLGTASGAERYAQLCAAQQRDVPSSSQHGSVEPLWKKARKPKNFLPTYVLRQKQPEAELCRCPGGLRVIMRLSVRWLSTGWLRHGITTCPHTTSHMGDAFQWHRDWGPYASCQR